jgi:nucleoside phosphorylase
MQVTACFFLCWEASTPLLNLRAQVDTASPGRHRTTTTQMQGIPDARSASADEPPYPTRGIDANICR